MIVVGRCNLAGMDSDFVLVKGAAMLVKLVQIAYYAYATLCSDYINNACGYGNINAFSTQAYFDDHRGCTHQE